MYNVLVADDEKLMRTYLANRIPEFTGKFQVTGIAKDGLEAMELLKKQRYDLVITDIQMPEADGLCLARYISENYKNVIVIIISGYNDFEYARKAIKYRVSDYLLKPLVDETLTELLEEIAERLGQREHSQFLLSEDQSSEEEMKKQLLSAILEENTNWIYEGFRKLEEHRISLMSSCACMVRFSIDELNIILKKSTPFDVTTDHLRLNQICLAVCERYKFVSLYDTRGITWTLTSADSERQLQTVLEKLCGEISEKAAEQNLPRITAVCGKTVADFMELTRSMQSIQEILPAALVDDRYPLLQGQAGKWSEFIADVHRVSENVFADYLTQSMDQLFVDIKKFCGLFQNDRSFKVILRCSSYLIQYISERANVNPSYIHKAYEELTRQVDTYLPMGQPQESAMVQIVISAVRALTALEPKMSPHETSQIVTTAQKYILSHYQENISLSDVAGYVGVSSSYLSDLFHRKLEEPYSKYLLRIRMEQAARILRENPETRIYKVAEQTGFVSVKHFNTVFKKYYGTTPTNFV